MKRLEKITSFSKYLLVLTLIFSIGFVSAATTLDDLHLNIQTTDGTGKVITGSFDFQFDITTDLACANTVYTKSENLATDSRGIISYYLDATNLDYDQQYYLCYYRDSSLIETMQIARSPYAFRAKYVNVSGIEVDSNLDLGNYNLTANYLFGDGSFLSGIDSAQINMSNFYNASQSDSLFVPYTGATSALNLGGQNVSANYFIGDGSYLTNLNVGSLDLSAYYLKTNLYNKSEINSFNSGFVPYSGATGNVDFGTNNATAQYYFGSGQYLTDINVDSIDLSEYYKKTEVYNQGETFNQTQITNFLNNVVPYTGATTDVNLGARNISAAYFIGDGSALTNLDFSSLDLSSYYTKSDVYNKSEDDATTAGLVPYSGATGNVNFGANNVTAQYYFGSGQYLTDLNINSLDLSEYYKKTQVYNQSEITAFNAGFVGYTGATQNVNLGSQNITASNFFGDGSGLTNLNVNLSDVNYWQENGSDLYYNSGNIGIGTDSPDSLLSISSLVDNTDAMTIRFPSGTTGDNIRILFKGNDGTFDIDYAGIVAGVEDWSADDGYIGFRTADNTVLSEKMRLSSAGTLEVGSAYTGQSGTLNDGLIVEGNVGIGTIAPDTKLHILDAINSVQLKVEADGSDDDSEILIDRAVNTQRASLKFTTNDALDWNVGTLNNGGAANSNFSISTSNNLANSAFIINPSGQVGIGDNTPDSTLMLDVAGNIGAEMICDENGANCVDVSSIEASVSNNPVVGFFADTLTFTMDYSTGGSYPATLTASSDFCGAGDYFGVVKADGSRQLITTPFGGTCTTSTLSSTNTEATKYLVWNHADNRLYFRYTTVSITTDEQVVGYYDGAINQFQWVVNTNAFRFGQTNNLNMGGNNIALNGGYLSGDGGNEGIAVDSTGRVGIGVAAPTKTLEVKGEINVTATDGDISMFMENGVLIVSG